MYSKKIRHTVLIIFIYSNNFLASFYSIKPVFFSLDFLRAESSEYDMFLFVLQLPNFIQASSFPVLS